MAPFLFYNIPLNTGLQLHLRENQKHLSFLEQSRGTEKHIGMASGVIVTTPTGYGSAGRKMTAEEEQRIRERAYSIWERECRPHGRDVDHRLRAEAEIAAERSRGGDAAHQHRDRGDDRGRLTSPRQAAEAIFTPSRQVTEQSVREGVVSTGRPVHKPRVLPISLPAPVSHEEVDGRISPKQQMTPKIARSQYARIRTLVRYGMTARQTAELYGVDVGEINRILQGG